MRETELTHRKIKCLAGELFKVCEDLKRDGWRISGLSVKGTEEYTVTAYLPWIESQDQFGTRPWS